MSMREYSVHDFGYVFSEKMIDQVIEKMKPKDIELGDTYEMADMIKLFLNILTRRISQFDSIINYIKHRLR